MINGVNDNTDKEIIHRLLEFYISKDNLSDAATMSPISSFDDILASKYSLGKLSVRKKNKTKKNILQSQVGVTPKLDTHSALFYQDCALEQSSYPKVSHRDFPYN